MLTLYGFGVHTLLSSNVNPDHKLILVTAHRRESFGNGFEQICTALAEIAQRPDVQIVYPVHPNPNGKDPVNRYLRGCPRVALIEPMDYVSFVAMLMKCSVLGQVI